MKEGKHKIGGKSSSTFWGDRRVGNEKCGENQDLCNAMKSNSSDADRCMTQFEPSKVDGHESKVSYGGRSRSKERMDMSTILMKLQ